MRTNTNGRAAATRAKNQEPITYADNGKAVTIRISGTAYKNLSAMAEAMNGVSWCDTDNTPCTLLENFVVGHWLTQLTLPTQMFGRVVCGGCGELAVDICDSIDTGYADEDEEHKRRTDELRSALLGVIPIERQSV